MPTLAQYESYLAMPTVGAFLDTIAWAEGGEYNKLFGGGHFSDYSRHPNRAVTAGNYTSTAAGRYQFLYSTWAGIANQLGLRDFSPHNQDIAALALINQRGQLGRVINGDLVNALHGLGCAWAALPFSGCGQPQRSLASTQAYYDRDLQARRGGAGGGGSNVQPTGIVEPVSVPALNPITAALQGPTTDSYGKQIFIVVGVGLAALLVVGTIFTDEY